MLTLLLKNDKLDPHNVLNRLVDYLDERKNQSSTISLYLTIIRRYLVYYDIDINPYKFRVKVRLPEIQLQRSEGMSYRGVVNSCKKHSLLYLI